PREHHLRDGRPPGRDVARGSQDDGDQEPEGPDGDVTPGQDAFAVRTAGSTRSPKSWTGRTGATARLTENMSRLTPAARAARTCARHSSGVPQIARRRLRSSNRQSSATRRAAAQVRRVP